MSVGFLGWHFWRKSHRPTSALIAGNPTLLKDWEVLQGPPDKAAPGAIQISLYRLNSYKTEEGKSEALRRLNNPNVEIRISVAQSLGMQPFEGEVSHALMSLARDPELKVRAAVYEGIGRYPEPTRKKFLLDRLTLPDLSDTEEIAIRFALTRVSTDPIERETQVKALVKKADPEKPEVYQLAINSLLRMNSKDSELKSKLIEALNYKNIASSSIPSLYRSVGRIDPEYIKKRFLSDALSEDPGFQRAALSIIPELCFKERWTAIQKVLTQPKVSPQSKYLALAIVRNLGGSQSKKLLSDPAVIKFFKGFPELEKRRKEALTAVEGLKVERCKN